MQGPNNGYQYNHANCSGDWQQSNNVSVQGGLSSKQLSPQHTGSITSLQCTPGHFGPFCIPCGISYYKAGWDSVNCSECQISLRQAHIHMNTAALPFVLIDVPLSMGCYFRRVLSKPTIKARKCNQTISQLAQS